MSHLRRIAVLLLISLTAAYGLAVAPARAAGTEAPTRSGVALVSGMERVCRSGTARTGRWPHRIRTLGSAGEAASPITPRRKAAR